MKKKIVVFVAVLVLILSSAGTVFAADVFSDGGAESDASGEFQDEMASGTQQRLSEVQQEYARMQLQISQNVQQIQELQAEQQKSIQFLTNARQLRSQAESSGQNTEMPDDMAAYMDARNLYYDKTGNDLLMDAFEWTEAIDSLEMYQVAVSTKVQQAMIDLQTSGVHGTYLAEANGRIAWSHEMLMGIARGQSMYGTSEAGLAVTGLVLGLVLGCVVTLGVQKLCRKNKQY